MGSLNNLHTYNPLSDALTRTVPLAIVTLDERPNVLGLALMAIGCSCDYVRLIGFLDVGDV